ncbi:hypothetical protein M434DRAFT_8555 [Hypoxylon sp. CO27-5]|nr:hypothetical protein M434DRAFT_8555 [Hypoxylon sp. CO27-5]
MESPSTRVSEPQELPNNPDLNLDTTNEVLEIAPVSELAEDSSHVVSTTNIEHSPPHNIYQDPTLNQPIEDPRADSATTNITETTFTSIPGSRPSLPLKESLGLRGTLGILGGYIGAVGILGFLVFLWFGHGSPPDGTEAIQLWRRIAMNDWMTRAITLSSAALRLIVSIQTTICTSMIAALLLEKYSVRRSVAAWFSVMRSMNDGPYKLVELTLCSKSLVVLRHVEFWLALLMVTVTLGLQFASTILLLDMKTLKIISDVNITSVPSLMEYQVGKRLRSTAAPGQWLNIPPSYPTFGEAQSGFSVDPNSNGVSDTGLIQRAFLPISGANDRILVREYDGNCFVLSSHVACMRPHITAEYNTRKYSDSEMYIYGTVEGQLHYNLTFENAQISSESLCSEGNCEPIPFGCVAPNSWFGWQSSSCLIDGTVLQFPRGITTPKWNSFENPWSRNSTVELIFSTNLQTSDWIKVTGPASLPLGTHYQEWMSYEILPTKFINVTLCFSAFNLERHHVKMTAPGTLQEKELNLPLMSSNHSSIDLQSFLGVSIPQQNHKTRQILDMKILGAPNDRPDSSPANSYVTGETWGNLTLKAITNTYFEVNLLSQFGFGMDVNITYLMCKYCIVEYGQEIYDSLAVLLGDIIEQTGRPANSMLTFISVVWSNIYYTFLNSLTTLQDAQIKATINVQAPGPCKESCPGFVTVTTLLLVHLLYVGVVAFLYIRRVRFSRHANIWHAISQLAAEGLKETLEQANDASDKTVNQTTRKEGVDFMVKLDKLEKNGKIEVVRAPTNNGLSNPGKSRFKRLKEGLFKKN